MCLSTSQSETDLSSLILLSASSPAFTGLGADHPDAVFLISDSPASVANQILRTCDLLSDNDPDTVRVLHRGRDIFRSRHSIEVVAQQWRTFLHAFSAPFSSASPEWLSVPLANASTSSSSSSSTGSFPSSSSSSSSTPSSLSSSSSSSSPLTPFPSPFFSSSPSYPCWRSPRFSPYISSSHPLITSHSEALALSSPHTPQVRFSLPLYGVISHDYRVRIQVEGHSRRVIARSVWPHRVKAEMMLPDIR